MTNKQKMPKEKSKRKAKDPLERVIAEMEKENLRLQVFNQVLQEQARKKVN